MHSAVKLVIFLLDYDFSHMTNRNFFFLLLIFVLNLIFMCAVKVVIFLLNYDFSFMTNTSNCAPFLK